jgi:hypothetical protein
MIITSFLIDNNIDSWSYLEYELWFSKPYFSFKISPKMIVKVGISGSSIKSISMVVKGGMIMKTFSMEFKP